MAGNSGHNLARGDFEAIDGDAFPLATYHECPQSPMGRQTWIRFGDYRSTVAQCHQENPSFDGFGGYGFWNKIQKDPGAGAVLGPYTNTTNSHARPPQGVYCWGQQMNT